MSLADVVISAIALLCKSEAAAIGPDTPLLRLNVDSLTLVSLAAHVEAAYRIEMHSDLLLRIFQALTVGELIAAFDEALAGRCSADDSG